MLYRIGEQVQGRTIAYKIPDLPLTRNSMLNHLTNDLLSQFRPLGMAHAPTGLMQQADSGNLIFKEQSGLLLEAAV